MNVAHMILGSDPDRINSDLLFGDGKDGIGASGVAGAVYGFGFGYGTDEGDIVGVRFAGDGSGCSDHCVVEGDGAGCGYEGDPDGGGTLWSVCDVDFCAHTQTNVP